MSDIKNLASELIGLSQEVSDALRSRKAREILDRVGEMPDADLLNIAALAAQICDVPIAAVGLIDQDTAYYKGIIYNEPVVKCNREEVICNLLTKTPDQPLVIYDTEADDRVCGLPFVNGTYDYVKFYHGLPLATKEGHAVGTICVLDRVTRRLRADQEAALYRLRDLVLRLVGA